MSGSHLAGKILIILLMKEVRPESLEQIQLGGFQVGMKLIGNLISYPVQAAGQLTNVSSHLVRGRLQGDVFRRH